MKKLLLSLLVLIGLVAVQPAQAATCFWVGGTGNWDNSNTASWSSSSGGGGGTCAATGGIPKQAADTATFDASSCGAACTVTVCGAGAANCPTSSGVLTLTTITFGACTNACVLDFSAINPTVNLSGVLNGSGSGTREFKGGSAIFNLSCVSTTCLNFGTVTNLTWTPGTFTVNITGNGGYKLLTFPGSGKTVPTLNVTGTGGDTQITNGNAVIGTLSVTAPSRFDFPSTVTTTVNNAITLAGTANSSLVYLSSNGSGVATVALGAASTCNWCIMGELTFTTNSMTATNSYSMGGLTFSGGGGLSNPPVGSGGGFVIGGG